VFDVRDMKLDAWIRVFRQLDHSGREVDASTPYVKRDCLRRENSWSGSHIQEIDVRPDPSRSKEGSNGECCYRRKEVAIGRRQMIVPPPFKGPEAIGILSR
jgi:hypothetical protein